MDKDAEVVGYLKYKCKKNLIHSISEGKVEYELFGETSSSQSNRLPTQPTIDEELSR